MNVFNASLFSETVDCCLRSILVALKQACDLFFYLVLNHFMSSFCFQDHICQFQHIFNFKLEISSLVPDNYAKHSTSIAALTSLLPSLCVSVCVLFLWMMLRSSSLFLSTVQTQRGPLRLQRQSLQVLWSYWANWTTPTTQVRWLISKFRRYFIHAKYLYSCLCLDIN